MKRFFLIDGNSFCYRAYYAVKHLSNSKGQPTNAVFGFASMIKKIINDEKPDMLAIAFDLKGPTFRHERFADYKVKRKPMPDDLVSQMPYIKKLVRAYNISLFELQGYEADDIIATITENAVSAGNVEVFIVTSDKDALQLVGPRVKVYNPHKDGVIYGAEEVKEKFGLAPGKITDLMALMGDASDNIPGVPGIGEKTAIELMKEFGSLDRLLENASAIKSPARRKKIEDSRDLALLSRELATIKRDVPIDVRLDELRLKEPDRPALEELFRELEFRKLLKDIAPAESPGGAYALVDDEKGFRKLLSSLERAKKFAFDFETTHSDPMRAEPVGLSFSWEECKAYYIPLNALKGISAESVMEGLKGIFENPKIKKIGQNIKYDMLMLKKQNIACRGVGFDTMVASYLLNPSKSQHNLAEIAFEHLGCSMTPIEELIGKGKKAVTMDRVEVGKVCDYCSADSDIALRLSSVLGRKLAEKGLTGLFEDAEIPLIDVLADMEWWGVCVDKKHLASLSAGMDKELRGLEKKIYALAGEEFNINSSKQLQVVLFERLKMPVVKKTKTGFSTDESVLRTLAEKEKLPGEILRYRELAKLKSTYADSLPLLVNPATGRIHTSFNQTVTATGRLSSSSPNLQNIPVRTHLGRGIRRAFVAAKKTHVLLAADYSQIELRILAHFSGDENLLRAFGEGRDIHAFTASLVYGIEEKDVTREMRGVAKTVNFGLVYGMSPFGLSRDLGIDVREAAKFIDAYFERYPGVKSYLEKTVIEAREKGFVTTILGRRRYISEIDSRNPSVRNFAERAAVNTPIQGSAADLIKLAMINIHKILGDYEAKMIMQVHDELVFEVGRDSLKRFAPLVRKGMEDVIKLSVPIRAKLEAGPNWLDMEELVT